MTTELVPKQITPSEIFVTNGLDVILTGVQKKVDEFNSVEIDIEIKKDRDKIRSFASNVAKSKTFIDKARIKYVKEKKEALKVIDTEAKRFRDSMDEIKLSVRKPLSDWEDDEKERIAEEERLKQMDIMHEEALQMHDLFKREEAIKKQQTEMDAKQAEIGRIAKEQKDKLEQIEREEQIRKDAAEKAERDAETARLKAEKDLEEEKNRRIRETEEKRNKAGIARSGILSDIGVTLDAETCSGMDESVWIEFRNDKNKIYQDEQNKIALDNMRRKQEKEKQDAIDKLELEKQEEIDRLKREQEEKDQTELKRIADEKAEADRLQKIEDERQKDVTHRKKINNNIVKCLSKFKIEKTVCEDIVKAIVKNEIPGLSVNY